VSTGCRNTVICLPLPSNTRPTSVEMADLRSSFTTVHAPAPSPAHHKSPSPSASLPSESPADLTLCNSPQPGPDAFRRDGAGNCVEHQDPAQGELSHRSACRNLLANFFDGLPGQSIFKSPLKPKSGLSGPPAGRDDRDDMEVPEVP
jgi:hypothetical protein